MIQNSARMSTNKRVKLAPCSYYAQTQNMKEDEDRLLAVCPCVKNEQHTSNAKRKPGYVYVIQS